MATTSRAWKGRAMTERQIELRLLQIEANQSEILDRLDRLLGVKKESLDVATVEQIFRLPDPVSALRERGRQQRKEMAHRGRRVGRGK